MHRHFNRSSFDCLDRSLPGLRAAWIVLLAIGAIFALSAVSAQADVVVVGDSVPVYDPENTDPNTNALGDAGGPVPGGVLIIGNTGVGGMFMDIAPPFSGTLMPLESTLGIIGNGPDSIGAVVMDDFGVEWQAGLLFSVGLEGEGYLDVFDSASVSVDGGPLGGGATFVGELPTGYGVITLNGLGSRLTTAALTVGNEGYGDIQVVDRGSLISVTSYVGREDGSDGSVTLTGLGTRWDLRGVLTIANNDDTGAGPYGDATFANGSVIIEDRAVLQARSVSGENPIKVAPRGFIELSGGTIRQLNVNADGSTLLALPVLNGGVIRGDGFIDASLLIDGSGELRNAAAEIQNGGDDTQLREKLLVSGPVVNNGTIESLGGEMEFQSPVINNLEFVARNAVMRFLNDPLAPGLDNNGAIVVGGNSTLHGEIVNNPGSSFTVLPNSDVLTIGDLTFTASSFFATAIGDSQGSFDVVGTTDITDSFLVLDYTTGQPSNPGDTYTILSGNSPVMGMFANAGDQAYADGRLWDIGYAGNSVTVTATPFAVTPFGADFNGDGIVNAADLAIWSANYGLEGPAGFLDTLGDADGDGDVDGADFLKIQKDLGGPPSILAAIATVPEPSALLLALSALVFGTGRRRSIAAWR